MKVLIALLMMLNLDLFADQAFFVTASPVVHNVVFRGDAGSSPVISFVKMKSVGISEVIDPWVVFNNSRDWYSVTSIAKDANGHFSIDKDRAVSVWGFVSRNLSQWDPPEKWGLQSHSPVPMFNIYGYGICDDFARVSDSLFDSSGLRSRCWAVPGHILNSVWFDNGWHLFDCYAKKMIVLEDGSIPSMEWAEKNSEEATEALLGIRSDMFRRKDGKYVFDNQYDSNRTMSMILRPRESLTRFNFNWGKPRVQDGYRPPPNYYNGVLLYEPYNAIGVHRMRTPYVFTGGKVFVDSIGKNNVVIPYISRDGFKWEKLSPVRGVGGGVYDIDYMIDRTGKNACEEFHVRVDAFESMGSGLNKICSSDLVKCTILADIQHSKISFPEINSAKKNKIDIRFTPTRRSSLELTIGME